MTRPDPNPNPHPLRIGIVGFGEVGSSFARGLLSEGVRDILAYDEPPGPLQRTLAERRSAELGVPLLPDPGPLGDRDLVFSSVTQDAAGAAAARCAGALSAAALYVDVNSLAPAAKIAVGAVVRDAGRRFVDAAIMGAPARDLHKAPILLAGPEAEAAASLLRPAGMVVEVVGAHPGMAAGIKILRSVLTKGLETLLVDTLVAAGRYGLQQPVLDSFCALLDERPARDTVDFLVRSHTVHAGRRALELEMSAATVADAGIDPALSAAVAARLACTAGGGLREALGGVPPATLEDALRALDHAIGGQPAAGLRIGG